MLFYLDLLGFIRILLGFLGLIGSYRVWVYFSGFHSSPSGGSPRFVVSVFVSTGFSAFYCPAPCWRTILRGFKWRFNAQWVNRPLNLNRPRHPTTNSSECFVTRLDPVSSALIIGSWFSFSLSPMLVRNFLLLDSMWTETLIEPLVHCFHFRRISSTLLLSCGRLCVCVCVCVCVRVCVCARVCELVCRVVASYLTSPVAVNDASMLLDASPKSHPNTLIQCHKKKLGKTQ